MSEAWFQATFGFNEGSYSTTRAHFDVSTKSQDVILTSQGNGRSFFVGQFDVRTVKDLCQEIAQLSQPSSLKNSSNETGGEKEEEEAKGKKESTSSDIAKDYSLGGEENKKTQEGRIILDEAENTKTVTVDKSAQKTTSIQPVSDEETPISSLNINQLHQPEEKEKEKEKEEQGNMNDATPYRNTHLSEKKTEEKEKVEEGKRTEVEVGGLGGLTFGHVTNIDVRSLISNPKNEGAVFQVASQFNCLEMVGPGVTPEDGVSRYAFDPTQGPACALACPAGTIYRNYFVGPPGQRHVPGKGQAGGDAHQINTMVHVEKLLHNSQHHYWHVKNGYLLPTATDKMKELNKKLVSEDSKLSHEVIENVGVGVHWNTEVECNTKHKICQVFTSAVPVAYAKSTTATDWCLLASLALAGLFEATLLAGAVLALRQHRRVTVYLTCVGGGAFGNLHGWILKEMSRAVELCKDYPLDVFVVHYGGIVSTQFSTMKLPKSVVMRSKEMKKRGV